MATNTLREFEYIVAQCRALFAQKTKDYGTAWRILRPSSITDQIYIKAKRIRSIQEKGVQKVGENIENEFVGILNYCAMALVQLALPADAPLELTEDQALTHYDTAVRTAMRLMLEKNHDYGEAWREMRVSSITDIILMKLLRTKQIEDNEGKTLVSEGVAANYQDMLNYAAFALILLGFVPDFGTQEAKHSL